MYCVRKITKELFWVGASDHRLALFENIHPIPRGVCYNSYLLLGEETVLFDAVDWSACRQLLENVDHLLNGRRLDCLVVHHVEPDHAASIGELLLRWPELKLAASDKAFQLMGQFGLGLDGHTLIRVKDGESLTLGGHGLTFLAAPMVHWPEVMVSFDATDGVLFSADAFGTFGAPDSRIFADEVDFDRDWMDEARRYYANIVGKYGVQVQGLLKKAAGLRDRLRYLCPLHGPVWRTAPDALLEKYDRWSRYEPEERGVLIVYASMYGNTESAAQALAARLCEKGLTRVAVYDVSNTHVSQLIAEAFRYSHIVLASVTYNLGLYPPMHGFLADMKALGLQKRTFALVESGAWAVKSGALMAEFIAGELKNCTLLEGRLSVSGALCSGGDGALDALADALIGSVTGE